MSSVSAEGEGSTQSLVTANGEAFDSLEAAFAAAEPDENGVISYEINGKAEINGTGWVQILKAGLSDAKEVRFVGGTDNAEIRITGELVVLADQENDIDVSFNNLKLTKPNPAYGGDYGHSTNYFTTWLRNTNAAENTVTYTNCEFPNGVCNNQYGKTVFNNCSFDNGTTGLYNLWVYGGDVQVEGGTFTGTRGMKVYTEGAPETVPAVEVSNAEFNGLTEKAAVVVSKAADVSFNNVSAEDCEKGVFQKDIEGSTDDQKVTIKANGSDISGAFNVTSDKSVEATKSEFNITGGTFTSEVSSDYCADGFKIEQNSDGSYGVAKASVVAEVNGKQYETLQAAIDAAGSGKTVSLLADTRENVVVSKNAVVLDLNGFTLNGGTEKDKPALKVDNKKVTVRDSSADQTGTIMREDTAENSGVSSHYVIDIQGKDGFLLFEGGNVKNNSGNSSYKGASLVRLGDDSNRSANPTLTIKGGTFTQNNFVAIKVDYGTLHFLGGEVTSEHSYAIENWCNANIKGGVVNGTVSTWAYSAGVAFSKLAISGGVINGDVASVNYDNASDKQARTFITGGEVAGTLGIYSYNNGLEAISDSEKAFIEVSGGTFDKDPSAYLTEDVETKVGTDGKFGVEQILLCKIGDTGYYKMSEAFKAVKDGETIVMLHNYTTRDIQKTGYKSYTIDLAGFTWTYKTDSATNNAFEANNEGRTLTVKNGAVKSNALVGYVGYDNAGLTFEKTEITSTGRSGIETLGTKTDIGITLKDSVLNVPNGFGVYFPSSGALVIDNSVINAKTMGVQVCAGSLSISGDGTAITVTGDAVPKIENDGAIEDGSAISIIDRSGYKDLGSVEIKSGAFTSKDGNEAIKAYSWDNSTKEETAFDNTSSAGENIVSVSGGTFSSIPSNMVDLCEEGLAPASSSTDGKVTYTVVKASVDENGYCEDISAYRDGGTYAAPVKDGYAFAGWYTDDICKTALDSNKKDGPAYAKFVEISELIHFKGGSLRMDESAETSASLRFGYITEVPEGSQYIESSWDWFAGGVRQDTVTADSRVVFEDGSAMANIVVKKISPAQYGLVLKVRENLKYRTVDGTEVPVVETSYKERSVYEVAGKIKANHGASKAEQEYADAILNTNKEN